MSTKFRTIGDLVAARYGRSGKPAHTSTSTSRSADSESSTETATPCSESSPPQDTALDDSASGAEQSRPVLIGDSEIEQLFRQLRLHYTTQFENRIQPRRSWFQEEWLRYLRELEIDVPAFHAGLERMAGAFPQWLPTPQGFAALCLPYKYKARDEDLPRLRPKGRGYKLFLKQLAKRKQRVEDNAD